MNPTIGQRMGRQARRDLDDAVRDHQYGGGKFYAPLQWKADEDDGDAFLKPVKFGGFANTAKADFGRDIVRPQAFTNSALKEFLDFGRQLLFMHDPFAQVGEVTEAQRVEAGKRVSVGGAKVNSGGLYVGGFVDSPVDPDTGFIPDHPLAKVIHFARMQVKKNRLKLMSIGWRPVKSKWIKAPDPRDPGGGLKDFREITSLILGEISLVTMAMSPESIIELRKAYESEYGEEITEALFSESLGSKLETIPERVDGMEIDRVRDLVVGAAAKAALMKARNIENDVTPDPEVASSGQLKLVSLNGRDRKKLTLTTLTKG